MGTRRRKRPRKHGLPPGTLIFTGDRHSDAVAVTLVHYDEGVAFSTTTENVIPRADGGSLITWYDLRGLHNVPLIEELGRQYNVHPLVLEDVLDTQQRPKFEDYDNGIFIIAQALSFDDEAKSIQTEQIGIFAGEGFVLSFQEKPDDIFAGVRERIMNAGGRIRKRGADYLVYALLDTIVDHYYLVMDKLEEVIDAHEQEVLSNPSDMTKGNIHRLKLQVLSLRKSVHPLREAINAFSRSENAFVQDGTRVFIRDIYDHTIQIIDSIESWRDIINGLFDLYLSQLSYRMNNVIQVLTIISTIFIPLTFLAGVYGMNFDNMPELHWKYGYFMVWGVMVFTALGLLYLFRRRKWL